MRDIVIEELAEQDIAEAIRYYDDEVEGLGGEFLNELKRLLPIVAENPRLFAAHRRNVRKAILNRFPYLVVYHFTETTITVLAVMHGKRSKALLRRRLKGKPG